MSTAIRRMERKPISMTRRHMDAAGKRIELELAG